jgi:ABC-type nitrate/sulfonate/bicarbonate transport system permease component
MRRLILPALQLGALAAVVLLWQQLTASGHLNRNIYGEPSQIWQVWCAWWDDGQLVDSTASTLEVVLLGMLAGIAIGCVMGTIMGISALARDITEPFVMFYNGLPRMMLLPLVTIPLGFQNTSKVVLVILVTWVIVALNVAAGCQQIPRDYFAHVRLLGGGRLGVTRDVWAPSIAVWVIASSRTTFQFAFATAVFAEFSGAPEGLGHLVVLGQQTFQINEVMAALLIVAALGAVASIGLDHVERYVGRWRPSVS